MLQKKVVCLRKLIIVQIRVRSCRWEFGICSGLVNVCTTNYILLFLHFNSLLIWADIVILEGNIFPYAFKDAFMHTRNDNGLFRQRDQCPKKPTAFTAHINNMNIGKSNNSFSYFMHEAKPHERLGWIISIILPEPCGISTMK